VRNKCLRSRPDETRVRVVLQTGMNLYAGLMIGSIMPVPYETHTDRGTSMMAAAILEPTIERHIVRTRGIRIRLEIVDRCQDRLQEIDMSVKVWPSQDLDGHRLHRWIVGAALEEGLRAHLIPLRPARLPLSDQIGTPTGQTGTHHLLELVARHRPIGDAIHSLSVRGMVVDGTGTTNESIKVGRIAMRDQVVPQYLQAISSREMLAVPLPSRKVHQRDIQGNHLPEPHHFLRSCPSFRTETSMTCEFFRRARCDQGAKDAVALRLDQGVMLQDLNSLRDRIWEGTYRLVLLRIAGRTTRRQIPQVRRVKQ
jgi:hypothetical protein